MSPDAPETPGPQSAPAAPAAPAPWAPPVEPDPAAPAEPDSARVTASGLPNPLGLPEIAVERPEVAVGAAFAGGLVLAMILKRLGR